MKSLVHDESKKSEEFPPGDKVYRSIIHEAAEIAGLVAHSFGIEGETRHVVVYKKEHSPSLDELAALRRGEKWDPDKAKEEALKKEIAALNKDIIGRKKERCNQNDNKITSKYLEKYEHLIGRESAKEAARKTEVKQQYGFVPSENKKDVRSIEQTLNDIRARKKLKTSSGQADSL
ncbi:sperm-associated antigen 7 homolog [Artemia franciscana]|nr:hypothetical protein QYM36_012915 [Artemia franciscana]